MGATYGLIAASSFKNFELLSLIKLPLAILAVGLVFELTLGQISWFKPTLAIQSSASESTT
jgi:hypothetical protein